jgi:hypothetical protein
LGRMETDRVPKLTLRYRRDLGWPKRRWTDQDQLGIHKNRFYRYWRSLGFWRQVVL